MTFGIVIFFCFLGGIRLNYLFTSNNYSYKMSKTCLIELIVCTFILSFFLSFLLRLVARDRLSSLNRVVPSSSSEKGAKKDFK